MSGKTPHTRRLKVLDERGQVVGEKEVVLYRGLLEMVHDERLHEVHTELIQAPSEDNHDTAIVRATVRTVRGSFTGIGDANPYNVDPKIVPHFIRMAETRAIARAIRVALAIGVSSFEEFGRDADLVLDEREDTRTNASQGPSSFDHHRTPPRVSGQKFGSMRRDNGSGGGSSYDSRASESQYRFLYRLLAQRGKSGEVARAFIHEALGVASLHDAPKHAVSALIDSLKSEGEGGNGRGGHGFTNGNGHPNGNGAHQVNGANGGHP